MMIKALFLACFLVIAFAGTCGGNCPSGSCPSCTCGYDKQILDLSAWCAAYNWDQYCCKCIFSRLSGGNANFMAHTSGTYPWTIGLFAINQVKKLLSSFIGLNVAVERLHVTLIKT